MERLIKYLLVAALLLAFAYNQTEYRSFAELSEPARNEKIATFAGGCFWATEEAMSELKGVNKVVSGYAGGTVKHPTYEQVCTRTTGHAECVQIYYNPEIITYATLVEAFFYAHDPTTLNRQGPDVGNDYRSVIFYRSSIEKVVIKNVIRKITRANHYANTIVTEVVPFAVMYPAEEYHQEYYKNHSNDPYIRSVSLPKVMNMRKEMWAHLKAEFKSKKIL